MKSNNIFNLVFSSSCTVYGEPEKLPITEENETGKNVTNVYGRTKYFVEEMLRDLATADDRWNVIALRYFNPVGAHSSGLIGEDPTKPFTNLMPFISQVAFRKKDILTIFGDDYNTPDGTGIENSLVTFNNARVTYNFSGIRDYIHVTDLATGHVAAMRKLENGKLGIKFYNLGTGQGVSVMSLIKTFERVNNVSVPFVVMPRRQGDISTMFADPTLAETELGWKAVHSLEQMCEDFWRWQTMNPDGYKTAQKANGH